MSFSSRDSRVHFGVAYAVVTDNKHPDGWYRVKVKFPWIRSKDGGDKEDYLSNWCRVASPMAGKGRGFVCLPEVDDEVLVAFEKGSMRYPVVIGSVWNKEDVPPWGDEAPAEVDDPGPGGGSIGVSDIAKDNNAQDGKNDARYLKTRHGHALIFDDGENPKVILKTASGHTLVLNEKDERLALYNHNQEQYLEFDAKNKKITVETVNGDIDVYCKNGTFTLEAKDIVMKASKTIDVKSDTSTKHESGSSFDIKAGATCTIKGGPKIDLNP